jgi:hypothetical protein
MQFAKGKPPEMQCAIRPGARAKSREVALGRPGFEPGRMLAWLSLRPSQGLLLARSLCNAIIACCFLLLLALLLCPSEPLRLQLSRVWMRCQMPYGLGACSNSLVRGIKANDERDSRDGCCLHVVLRVPREH